MKKIHLTITALFFIVSLSAQELEKAYNYPDAVDAFATFNIVPIAFYAHPRVQLGYYKKYNDKFWVGADVATGFGKMHDYFLDGAINSKDYRLFEVRPEIYYNLRKPTKKLRRLLSLELFYIYHSDTRFDSFYHDIKNKEVQITFDKANYQRIKYGVNLNYNFIIHLGRRVSLFHTIGFGVKHRNVGLSKLENAQAFYRNYERSYFDLRSNDYLHFEGRYTNFNVDYDIKLVVKL